MGIDYDEFQLNMNCGSKEIGHLRVYNPYDNYDSWKDVPVKHRPAVIRQLKAANRKIFAEYGRYNLIMTDTAEGLIYQMMKHVSGWKLIKKWKNPNTNNINYMWVNTKVRRK